MAGSFELNAAVYKKQSYKYVAPTPPSKLLESSVFTIDFTNRKFINVGIDSHDNFNIAIHIITPSRYINISPQILERIYSKMGNILSVILDPPQKCLDIIFLDDDTITLSKTIYRGQNYLVINSRAEEGCRVLLNRGDLFTLQDLERVIFDSVLIKSTTTRSNLIYQFKQLVNILTEVEGGGKIMNVEEMKNYISHIPDEKITITIPPSQPTFINQFRLFSLDHLAEETFFKLESKLANLDYSPPSLSCVDQPMLNVQPTYSLMSPTYSPMLPLSPPTLDENDGPSFYDLLHMPPTINISAPKKMKNAKHVYPVQSERNKRGLLFQDMLCDN